MTRLQWTEKALIVADSTYTIGAVKFWHTRQKIRSWKKPQGISFANMDLIEAIVEILRRRRKAGGITDFCWVKGHSGDAGNDVADRLASFAAQ